MKKYKCQDCAFASVCEDISDSKKRCRYYTLLNKCPAGSTSELRNRLNKSKKNAVISAKVWLSCMAALATIAFLAWTLSVGWSAISTTLTHIAAGTCAVVLFIVTARAAITVIRKK